MSEAYCFRHVSRSWDPLTRRHRAKLLPGEFYVTGGDDSISTLLGSCIAACIRDPAAGVGGMNHFMLPGCSETDVSRWAGKADQACRYGIAAMEMLVNELQKMGARRERLEMKLFGGARLLNSSNESGIGARNIEFARRFARDEGLRVSASDLGGDYPRRVVYCPASGKVRVKLLPPQQVGDVCQRESRYQQTLQAAPASNTLELF